MRSYLYIFLGIFSLLACEKPNHQAMSPSKPEIPHGPQPSSKDTELSDLEHYLSKARINKKVLSLAQQGYKNYQKSPLQETRASARDANQAGGGRNAQWIPDTFGASEVEIVESLSSIDGPKTWKLATINKTYEEAVKRNPPAEEMALPRFILVKGLSVNYWHDYQKGKAIIVQLASQFNFLEAVSPRKMPVSAYLYDRTQGPQGSIEAAAAALHRSAAEAANKLPHALTHVLVGDTSTYYQNGYFEPFKLSEDELEQVLETVKKNSNNLLILPQWAMCEASGNMQLQVFSAAPSYQGASTPLQNSIGEKLCDFLVSIQYEAIGKMAVIRSIVTNEEVEVHLSLVGQGAFNNPLSVMESSFSKLAAVVRGYDKIKIYIHAYDDTAQAKVRVALSDAFELLEMTKEEFMQK